AAHPPVVFNTGQVVFGLLAAWQVTGESAFLESAVRAGGWLARVQDADGAWRRHDYLGGVHAYNARTAWALVELGTAVADRALLDAATRHLDWVLTQQDEDGWYRSCGFGPGDVPFLHTIAYTSQGLLEAGLRLGRSDYVAAAERTCRAVARRVSPSGAIAGSFDRGWRPVGRSSCLTGNAQMAVQWLRLYETTRDAEYRDVAVRALSWLKALHDCDTRNPNVRGAVKGSHPIWGRYLFGTYPNWAVKFFMDALLLEERVVEGRKACIRCW
ncbi:MAG TPA: hypothetical protein VNN07_05765, partial [Candidatus Tectomicrobia bacterium]|nr:hypothetical protein [Candidatus Tectomicrobia bacterium]